MKKVFIFLYFFSFSLFLFGCESKKDYDTLIYTMDTYVSIKLYSTTKEKSKEIFDYCEEVYEKYNNLTDFYQSYSGYENIYDLNKNRSINASKELIDILNYSIKMKNDTNGYFNPFIGELGNSWKESLFPLNGEAKVLNDSYITDYLKAMENASLSINNSVVSISEGVSIDLGGVAKGYATNLIYEYFKSNNITNYLINAGSSSICCGTKTNDKEISVGIKKVYGSGYLDTIKVKNMSIGTSSIREQYVTIDGVIYHHIINPFTGYPANNYDSISLLGTDSGLLDAYSTACFSMDLDTLKEFLTKNSINAYVFKNDSIVYTNTEVSK